MSNIEFKPRFVNGTVNIPSSKSIFHRALIASALSNRKITIKNVDLSKDIIATIDALKSIGYSIEQSGNTIIINGIKNKLDNAVINANESGSTLRFLIPLTVSLGIKCTFVGNGELPKRPLNDYLELFDSIGVKYYKPSNDFLPLEILSTIDFDEISIKGSTSSQFVSGIMFCGMINPIKIRITDKLSSKHYVDITAKVLKDFGCNVTFENNIITVNYNKCCIDEYCIEKDWTQCAVFLCAGAINGNIAIENMNFNSSQGDKIIVDILKEFGADISIKDNIIIVRKSYLRGIKIDAKHIPDLVPILSVLGCYATGKTIITNVNRLRFKESNRLLAITTELSKLGADIKNTDNEIIIKGGKVLNGTKVSSCNDHRIAMALTVASLRCNGNVILEDYESINKSYPKFYEDWGQL